MGKSWKRVLSMALALLLAVTCCIPEGTALAAAKKVAKPTKITLNCKSADTYVGGTVKLKVSSVKPKKSSAKVSFRTSNRKVATVTQKGVVRGKKPGTATITATSKANPKAKAKCRVRVYKATKKIKLSSKKSYTLDVGKKLTLKAKVINPKKGAQPIRWKSGNRKAVRVTSKGKVTAVSAGNATVTGQSGKVKVKVKIKVKKKPSGNTGKPEPKATPTPTPAPTPEPKATPTPEPKATPTPAPAPAPEVTPTPAPEPEITPTPPPVPEETPKVRLTRGEWIAALTGKLGYSVEQGNLTMDPATGDVLHVYDDIDGDAHAMEIEAAYSYGVLPALSQGDGEPRLFLPDSPATREFAAATAVRALGFAAEEPLGSSDSSGLECPNEDKVAVDLGMLALKGDKFCPKDILSEEEEAAILAVVDQTLKGREIDPGHEDSVAYTDEANMVDWTGTAMDYTLLQDGEGKACGFSIPYAEGMGTLQEGNILMLPASKEYPAGAFLKVSGIERQEGGTLQVTGETPELSEVFQSVDLEGYAGAYLEGIVPAEGVELTYVGTAMEDAAYSGGPAMGRASTGGVQEQSLGLSMRVAYQDGKISLEAGRFAIGLDWENLSTGAATEWAFEFAVPRIAYSIDGDFGDPSAPQLRELYLAMENSATLSAGVQAGTDFPPVKIANVPFQLGWGFYINLGLYFTYGAEGSAKVSYAVEGVAGMQYAGGKMQNISKYGFKTGLEAEAAVKAGLSSEIALNWLVFEVYGLKAEAGVKAAATATKRSDRDLTCTDIRLWGYCEVELGRDSVIGNVLHLTFRWTIYDEGNSPLRINPLCHIENGEKVEKCTYGDGSIKGRATDASGEGIGGCAVTVLSGGNVAKRVQTQPDGSYSVQLTAGEYGVMFYKKGYLSVSRMVVLAGQQELEVSAVLEKDPEQDIPSIPSSGNYYGIDWSIDGNGLLTLTGEYSGEDYIPDFWRGAPWYENRGIIQSAKVVVSGIVYMTGMFEQYDKLQSVDFTGTDTGNVTSMAYMFSGCSSLTNVDVSGFDTGNVTGMDYMFWDCSSLKNVDVSGFDTGNVTNMQTMFGYCRSLTSVDVSGFNTGNVTDMERMFWECNSLTNVDVSGFDTGNVWGMGYMFSGCHSLKNLDVSGFNTGNVGNMGWMFSGCGNLANVDVSGFDTGNVTDMSEMFFCCSSLTNVDVSGFDTGKVTDMDSMFYECNSLTSVDMSGFDTGKVTGMNGMFSGCSSLTNVDVSGFDTGNVMNMNGMFSGCSSLTNVDVSGFDTGNVRNMVCMFSGCSSLTNVDVSGFDTGNVTGMDYMFSECSSLTNVDVSGFDTGNVTGMDYMFYGCRSLTSLNLKNFNIGKVDPNSLYSVFAGCENLKTVDVPSDWPIGAIP